MVRKPIITQQMRDETKAFRAARDAHIKAMYENATPNQKEYIRRLADEE
jgi:predicted alpha/beta hydrolase